MLDRILQEIRDKVFCVEAGDFYSDSVVMFDDVEEVLTKYLKEEPLLAISAGVDAADSVAAPVIREAMQVCIGGRNVSVYKDEVVKEFEHSHFPERIINYGA